MKSLFMAALLAVPALAQAEKVKLDVKVVEASSQGNSVDPKVAHLERDLKHMALSYTSYKLDSEAAPTVDYNQSTDVPLPNGKTLKITPLEHEKDGKIRIKLDVPGLGNETYSVPNKGRHVFGAGSKDHGKPTEAHIFAVITATAQ